MPFLLLITFLSTTPGWFLVLWYQQNAAPAAWSPVHGLEPQLGYRDKSGKSGPKGLKRQKSNEKEPNMLILKSP